MFCWASVVLVQVTIITRWIGSSPVLEQLWSDKQQISACVCVFHLWSRRTAEGERVQQTDCRTFWMRSLSERPQSSLENPPWWHLRVKTSLVYRESMSDEGGLTVTQSVSIQEEAEQKHQTWWFHWWNTHTNDWVTAVWLGTDLLIWGEILILGKIQLKLL